MPALIPTSDEAHAAWAERVRANRDQAERVREGAPPTDFYAPVAAQFRADPHRTDEPTLNVLRSLVQPGETWLDIGAGGGRYTLPLALVAGRMVAVEPSAGMQQVLREGMAEHGITNIDIVTSTWPMADAPAADVAFISHVGYDIEAIGPFLDGMERAARRRCVAVLLAKPPAAFAAPVWPAVHGEERIQLPALPEFLALLLARGTLFEVQLAARQPMSYPDRETVRRGLLMQLFVPEDSPKVRDLDALIAAHATERDGRWALSWDETPVGIVTWEPRRAR
jgi:SAM-dependent methyltransferase